MSTSSIVSDSGYEGDTEQNEIDVGEQAKFYIEEEDPLNSQILPSETGEIDFNLQLPTISDEIVSDEDEDKLETSVNKQSQLASSEATKLVEEIEEKRTRKLSHKMLEIKQTEEQLKYEKANPPPAPKKSKPTPKQNYNEGEASDFHESVGTAAGEIIQRDIRLESYSATSQAKKIYGPEFTILTALTARCALCGCMFKDRISYSHNKKFHPGDLKRLTITYDHFAPVNFSALVFRIPVAAGVYTPEEMNLFRLNGHMTCYHCNYVKSQRMFITCPKEGGVVDFDKFEPNYNNIKKFFEDLVDSKNVHGLAEDGSKTLDKCLKGQQRNVWIEKRVSVITAKADALCNQIKQSVNLENVKKRIQMTKIIIRKATQELKEDAKFNGLSPKNQYRYKREYISRVFGELELTFTMPWNKKPAPAPAPAPATNKPYTPVRILSPLEKQEQLKIQQQSVDRLSVPKGNVSQRGREQKTKSYNQNTSFGKNSSDRSRSRSRKGGLRSKRKTYRRIKLF
jgi:hypothetical protein